MSYPFDVEMARNVRTNAWELRLRVTGLESKKVADDFAENLAEWMTTHGGGEYHRYQ